MSQQSTPSSQQPGHDELAAMRRELATVHARLDRVTRRPTRRRLFARLAPLGIVALLVALLPLSLLAANPFTDLVPGSVHNGNIDAIYNAGITTGCVPNAEYCPTDFVTRQEMASFLARTAGLGGNPAVANAATALNANQLGGQPASAYVRTSAAFVHTVTPASINPGFPNYSLIDNPLTNGQPGAILLVTQNWEPNDVYNAHEIGVFYRSDAQKWAVFNQDIAAMPVGASFNVLVIQP